MSIADIILSAIIWLVQKLVIPILPVNLPFLSFNAFNDLLNSSLKHNINYAFAGLNKLFNLKLLFTFLIIIIFAEILFWLFRTGLWVIKTIRG